MDLEISYLHPRSETQLEMNETFAIIQFWQINISNRSMSRYPAAQFVAVNLNIFFPLFSFILLHFYMHGRFTMFVVTIYFDFVLVSDMRYVFSHFRLFKFIQFQLYFDEFVYFLLFFYFIYFFLIVEIWPSFEVILFRIIKADIDFWLLCIFDIWWSICQRKHELLYCILFSQIVGLIIGFMKINYNVVGRLMEKWSY